jgi:hypothetical protein
MNNLTKGLLLVAGGVAIGIAIPVVFPAIAEGGRPLAKALAKHGTLALGRLRVATARARESLEDFIAEVKSEVSDVEASASSAAAPIISVPEQVLDKKVFS